MCSTTRREFLLAGGLGAFAASTSSALSSTVRSILGARNQQYASESHSYTAADYVQDGLLTMWDGIENVGWEEHDDNSATWKNLVGSTSAFDFVVQNGYFNVDSLSVTGVNYTQSSDAALSSDILTTEIALTIPTVKNAAGSIFEWRFNSAGPFYISTAWGYFRITGAGHGNYRNDNNSFDLKPYVGGVFRATMTDFIGQSGLYVNGQLVRPTFTADASMDNRFRPAIYAAGQGDIQFHSIRVYNRILSATEIAYNCTIDKERFGI